MTYGSVVAASFLRTPSRNQDELHIHVYFVDHLSVKYKTGTEILDIVPIRCYGVRVHLQGYVNSHESRSFCLRYSAERSLRRADLVSFVLNGDNALVELLSAARAVSCDQVTR